MADNDFELRSIDWTSAFPFVRLFRTFKLSIHAYRLLLSLVCVLACYIGGRILDRIWIGLGSGVPIALETWQTEVDAYAAEPAGQFSVWKTNTATARRHVVAKAAIALGNAESMAAALPRAASQPVSALTQSARHTKDLADALRLVDERVAAGLKTLKEDKALASSEKKQRRHDLERAADYLRLVLTDHDTQRFGPPGDPMIALLVLESASGSLAPEQRLMMNRVLPAQVALHDVTRSRPRGPFAALLQYEMRCFAGAVRGVCTLHWGFAGGAQDPQPALVGSLLSAGRGVLWFVTQRPCFAGFYALWHLLVFALLGGAICRHAAVHSARDESIGLGQALRFAWDKYLGLLAAPLVPAGMFVAIAIALWLGGLVGAIPWLGELLTGILFGLALLAGFALAMILIATVLGFHLMWPTIAVEGSDAFDAVTHAAGYLGQRTWKTGFYSLLLLLYGGVAFVMVRVIAMVLLKLAHLFTSAGMSWFGCWSSSHTSTFTKLNAMWQMPRWEDLPLLPTIGGTPFWGTFNNAPLNGSEWLAMIFIMCWVFLVVGLVGAFVVSFFFCGSTQMYFLLRRDVDAVDYDEIFFEEPEETPPGEPLTEAAAPAGPFAPPPPSEPPAPTPPGEPPTSPPGEPPAGA